MAHYRFVATTFKGETEEGVIEASSLYDFYGVMNREGLQVRRVVDVSGTVPGVKVPRPPIWRPLGFACLLGLVGAVVGASWLDLPQKQIMLLLPALALLTVVSMVTFRMAVKAPVALMPAVFLEGVRLAPTWLRLFLFGILTVALGQFGRALLLVASKGSLTSPLLFTVRGILGIGVTVPLLVLGAALAIEIERRRRLDAEDRSR